MREGDGGPERTRMSPAGDTGWQSTTRPFDRDGDYNGVDSQPGFASRDDSVRRRRWSRGRMRRRCARPRGAPRRAPRTGRRRRATDPATCRTRGSTCAAAVWFCTCARNVCALAKFANAPSCTTKPPAAAVAAGRRRPGAARRGGRRGVGAQRAAAAFATERSRLGRAGSTRRSPRRCRAARCRAGAPPRTKGR